ncbi:SH3 domain-containing protein [Glutamicibacter arilaitensis]
MRTGAGAGYRSLGVVPLGEKTIKHTIYRGWSKVFTSEGARYVSSRYLSTAELHLVRVTTNQAKPWTR